MLQQLERLQKDHSELEIYALKLKKRGMLDKMNKILKKRDFIEDKIKLMDTEVRFSTQNKIFLFTFIDFYDTILF